MLGHIAPFRHHSSFARPRWHARGHDDRDVEGSGGHVGDVSLDRGGDDYRFGLLAVADLPRCPGTPGVEESGAAHRIGGLTSRCQLDVGDASRWSKSEGRKSGSGDLPRPQFAVSVGTPGPQASVRQRGKRRPVVKSEPPWTTWVTG